MNVQELVQTAKETTITSWTDAQALEALIYRLGNRVADYRKQWRKEHPGPVTKWDALNEREREEMRQQRYGDKCSGCQTWLETEADFAKHYVLDDMRYLNLGHCPSKEA